jgi:hypothetical protein
MSVITWRFRIRAGGRRRVGPQIEHQHLAIQRTLEQIEDGLNAGCLPHPLASGLIARTGKRGSFRLTFPVAHV